MITQWGPDSTTLSYQKPLMYLFQCTFEIQFGSSAWNRRDIQKMTSV